MPGIPAPARLPQPPKAEPETTGALKSPHGAQPRCRPGMLLHLLVCKVEVKVMDLRSRLMV